MKLLQKLRNMELYFAHFTQNFYFLLMQYYLLRRNERKALH